MWNAPDALMLFAAGFGTRMGALTQDRPKPMVEVAGRPLIDHALSLAQAAGISRIVANVHYLPDQVRDYLIPRRIAISDESDAILETGGGLRKALPLLGEGPVFTLNTDAVWTGADIVAKLRAAWDPARMDALLMLVPTQRAVGHRGAGDFSLAPDGQITRGAGYVYTGLQILNPAGLEEIADPAFSLNVLWDRILREGRAYGLVHEGAWCDVGRPESIALAEDLLRGAHV
jgi:N-acetyl-alpha-D-muramate 1-phosphate uridylyltransferase